ncbi:MAG: hypothetical protein MUP69_10470 [Candidatus Atribacteria bacterium]|nr:hypothetical protein [Candidatus Atribacteria bacterium]
MPRYILECLECGRITEVTCSYEALSSPRLFCMRYNVKKDGMCGGKFRVKITTSNFVSRGIKLKVQKWIKERGL